MPASRYLLFLRCRIMLHAQADSTGTQPAHITYLDSARGLAAFSVVMCHYLGWKYNHELGIKLSFFIFNGADAVSFFFVLSGMVLSYKYITLGYPLDLRKYCINRFFRLFPGFFVAVLVNALYWHKKDLSAHAMGDMLLRNNDFFWEEALLIRNHTQYFGAGWTLTWEYAGSLLLPFLMVIFVYNRKLIPALMVICLLAGNTMLNMKALHFLGGMLVAGYFGFIQSDAFRQLRIYRFRYLILLAAFILYSVRHIDNLSQIGPSLIYVLKYLDIDFFVLSGAGAFVFLVWIVHNRRVQRILSHPILTFLGKISYGMYLMHWLIVAYTYDKWDVITPAFPNEWVAFYVMLLVTVASTIILATILYYLIEMPGIRLGKRLAARMKPYVILSVGPQTTMKEQPRA